MTNEREGRMCERANGRKENNAYLFTRSLVYSFTDYTTLSSLRGTKQSMTMNHKRVYNDKGCMSIREGILECFASLAMTNEREGRKDERKITLLCSLVHLSTRFLTTQPCRHCEARSNPGL
ncbi:MAG: hypothetical protein LBL13_06625 [Bacteroidales bacterium]|nr:hypothetical protein [Bacteroidales bacterium]